jgi:hypothetical protein
MSLDYNKLSVEYNLSSQGKITEMRRKQVQEQMKPK